MTNHEPDLLIDAELDRRLRRSLTAVAETVTVEPLTGAATIRTEAPSPRYAKRRNRRRLAIALALAALPLAAFGYALAPEDVDQIPPKNAFLTGSDAGKRYWVVPSFHKDSCGRPMDGVELVAENTNKVGQEWKTAGLAYGDEKVIGEPAMGCYEVDESAWLADPSRTAKMSQPVDESSSWPRIVVLAVHPSVTAVRITAVGLSPRTVPTEPMPSRPDGPRYTAFVTPSEPGGADIQWTLLTSNGGSVPGGTQTLTSHR